MSGTIKSILHSKSALTQWYSSSILIPHCEILKLNSHYTLYNLNSHASLCVIHIQLSCLTMWYSISTLTSHYAAFKLNFHTSLCIMQSQFSYLIMCYTISNLTLAKWYSNSILTL